MSNIHFVPNSCVLKASRSVLFLFSTTELMHSSKKMTVTKSTNVNTINVIKKHNVLISKKKIYDV